MNTLFNKKNLLLLVMVVIFISPALAGEKDSEDTPKELNYELLDPFYKPGLIEETITVEFYDFNDNLVYKTTISEEKKCNAKLAKYLNMSDYLTEYAQTSYYRLNN